MTFFLDGLRRRGYRVLGPNALKIIARIAQPGQRPGFRQLMQHTGIRSLNGIAIYVGQLERLGLVTHEPHEARTVRLTCRFIPAEKLEAEHAHIRKI